MDADRIEQLCASPGGGVLLGWLADGTHTLVDLADPIAGPSVVSAAVAELSPWWDGHADTVEAALRCGREHRDLAADVVDLAGAAGWWSPLRRERQVWLKPYESLDFPDPDTHFTPTEVGGFDLYAQRPADRIATSTLTSTAPDDWSAHHACAAAGHADWVDDYEASTRTVRVSPAARVAEIGSAADWHNLVARHGVTAAPADRSDPRTDGEPWGSNGGRVPDWPGIAAAYDGVHITQWAFLTATQVRVASPAGWSELWACAGEETTWLRWVFEEVGPLRPFDPREEIR
ncbi:hypothetical protein ACFWPA_18325 [Rhodococcus sp. NPDC058505]|uniref:hypothetical protein n=1 Tax=Rhodococcus sp. NPDC058505 TaxID=3346531 RepID=UPI00365B499F